MSEFMKNSTATMENLFGNRKQYHEISEHVFQPATKARRMSAQMENNARNLEQLLAHRPEKQDIDDNMWITAKDVRGGNGRRVSHAMFGKQKGLEGLLSGRKEHFEIDEKVFREPTKKEILANQMQDRQSR